MHPPPPPPCTHTHTHRVMIRSSNKTTDPELLGQEGVVNRVEPNGWVELHIPKLGAWACMHACMLQPMGGG